MTQAATVVIALNSLMVCAVMVRAASAFRRGLHDWRTFHAVVFAIAGLYLAGYGWLVFGGVDRKTWSEVMVGVSVVVWPAVWITPSEFSIRSQRAVEKLRNRVVEYEHVITDDSLDQDR